VLPTSKAWKGAFIHDITLHMCICTGWKSLFPRSCQDGLTLWLRVCISECLFFSCFLGLLTYVFIYSASSFCLKKNCWGGLPHSFLSTFFPFTMAIHCSNFLLLRNNPSTLLTQQPNYLELLK
jgi:hypothetical protein